MALDRRRRRRLNVATEDRLTLRAACGGAELRAIVKDLSQHGLMALLHDGTPPPAPGAPLEEASLGSAGEEWCRLPHLRLADVAATSRGTLLRLVTDDPGTRAALWNAMARLAHRPKAPVPETLPRIPGRGRSTEAARQERLSWLRQQAGLPLAALQAMRVDAEDLRSNVENALGAVEVPVGLAGPLLVHGRRAQGLCYLPMATTEGTLVASATRGATALAQSGGVVARVVRRQMMRVPVFVLEGAEQAHLFARWLRDHQEEVGQLVRHAWPEGELTALDPLVAGPMVHVTFGYASADLASPDRSVACTFRACRELMERVRRHLPLVFEHFQIEGNTGGARKVSFRSLLAGRGLRVVAEATIAADVLQRVLKVTPQQILLTSAVATAGSVHTGMVGHAVNVASVMAAFFVATGQELGSLHESSVAQLHLHGDPGGVYASLIVPSLVISTSGAGTHLPAQRDILDAMGCVGPEDVERLAEVVAAFALASEVSTLAAIAAVREPRPRSQRGASGLMQADVTAERLSGTLLDPDLRAGLREVVPGWADGRPAPSLWDEVALPHPDSVRGARALTLRHDRGAAEVVLKALPSWDEAEGLMLALAAPCGKQLSKLLAKVGSLTGFVPEPGAELAAYRSAGSRAPRHMPELVGVLDEPARGIQALLLGRVVGTELPLPGMAAPGTVDAVVGGLARIHADTLGPRDRPPRRATPVQPSGAQAWSLHKLWEALAAHGAEVLPDVVGPEDLDRRRRVLRAGEASREGMPHAVVLGGIRPEGLVVRGGAAGAADLVVLDWDLGRWDLPQRDLAEVLCYVLAPDAPAEEVERWLHAHRAALEREAGIPIDADAWRRGFKIALGDLLVRRFALLLMVHTVRPMARVEQAVLTLHHLLDVTG